MYLKLCLKYSLAGLLLCTTACSSIGNFFNPFYDDPTPEAMLGERNDFALSGSKQKAVQAREALEAMSTYRRAQAPMPADPVVQPAVMRLMWIPDHLTKSGDLVPQHFYYLFVLRDRPLVTDTFDMEQQLNAGAPAASGIPYSNVSDGY